MTPKLIILIAVGTLVSKTYAQVTKSGLDSARAKCEVSLDGQTALVAHADPMIVSLTKEIEELPDATEWGIKVVNGQVHLKIGALRRENRMLNLLMLKAFKSGKIAEIDAGKVVSPKVFILLWHLLEIAEQQKLEVLFYGQGTISRIFDKFEMQKKIADSHHAEYLSPTDRVEFGQALETLGATQSCLQNFLNCGCRMFTFLSGAHPHLQWNQCVSEGH